MSRLTSTAVVVVVMMLIVMAESTFDDCKQVPQSGSCGRDAQHLTRWYYDVASQSCIMFIWNNCPGEAPINVHLSEDVCRERCING